MNFSVSFMAGPVNFQAELVNFFYFLAALYEMYLVYKGMLDPIIIS